ncbi:MULTISPECIES: bleomycin resistance protein [Pseudomonas]|uniref:bleomycin resistance protein n=1 Tax=Pseudomonas TaxID=286 RepID=UPI0014750774|nr:MULTISPECIES: VOC family protein [Pseudomonas]NNA56558.1 VOC family protein [Pseudomonas koreensis]
MFIRNKLVPELIVTDLPRSLHFWTTLVGFEIAYERPEEGFAYLDLNGAQIMLEQHNSVEQQWLSDELAAPFGRGINLQIEVICVDSVIDRLQNAQWPLFLPREIVWYRAGAKEVGQCQFLVQDPDGYLVRLVENLGERSASSQSSELD